MLGYCWVDGGGLPKLHLFSWGLVGGVGWGGGVGCNNVLTTLVFSILACYADDPCPLACYVTCFFLKWHWKIRRPWWWTLSSSSRRRSASGKPPRLPKMLFLGFHPCGSSFSVGGSPSCWILLIFIYGYPGYLWFIKFMSLHLPAWETVFVQQNGHAGRRTRWTLAPSTLRHPPFHGRSQKWKRRSHGNFVLECLGTGG